MHCQGHLQSTLCRWPGKLFSRTLFGHNRETSTAGSECHTGMGDKEWLQVCSPQVQSHTFHCTTVSGSETPHCEDWKHTSASWGVHKVPWAVMGLAPLIQEAHQCAEDTVQGGSQPHPSGRSLEMGRDRDTLLMLYRATVRSKFDYCCIVCGTASNTDLRQLDSIHNSGLRLALGAFCTSPVSSLYTEANKAPLEERWLKLSMQYYVKTRACIDNPAHHALHEFDRTTIDLYAPRPNGRGGMTRPPTPPTGLKVEEATTSAEINAELICPLRTPNFPPGTHDYDPKRHDLIEGISKCMISGQEAQAKFNEFREAQGSHDEVYTDGSKMN